MSWATFEAAAGGLLAVQARGVLRRARRGHAVGTVRAGKVVLEFNCKDLVCTDRFIARPTARTPLLARDGRPEAEARIAQDERLREAADPFRPS